MRMSWVLVALVATTGPASALPTVVHPADETQGDSRNHHPLAVLHLALEASGTAARLEPFPVAATQERAIRLVEQGRLDVMWAMATNERMARLRAIPYPIDRGLLGWRLLLVPARHRDSFAGIRDLKALSAQLGVQGHDWPDLAIQRANGLPMLESTTYPGVFEKLRRGRATYASRSVVEVRQEADRFGRDGLVVAPGLAMHYRAPQVFFVNAKDEALGDAIERGLRVAMQDGRLDELFERTFGADLARLEESQPVWLRLRNPLLDDSRITDDPRWWWTPESRP